jgi:hypothetical protein
MNRAIRNTLILSLCLIPWGLWADSSRSHGNQDSSRHGGQTDTLRSTAVETAQSPTRMRPLGTIHHRPYDRQPRYGYWSKKCIRQRSSSLAPLNHTRDCDNPAYTGGYYPHPYAPPYGQGGPVIIINNYGGARHR